MRLILCWIMVRRYFIENDETNIMLNCGKKISNEILGESKDNRLNTKESNGMEKSKR